MMITPHNILRHELTGLEVKAFDKNLKECLCEGKVSGETRNTLRIRCGKESKTIPKNGAVFEFKLPSKAEVRVDGKHLISRPEDRIKKKIRIKFV